MFVKVEISQVCRWAWSPSAVAVHCFAESEPGANKCAEKRTCTAEALCQCPAVSPPPRKRVPAVHFSTAKSLVFSETSGSLQ